MVMGFRARNRPVSAVQREEPPGQRRDQRTERIRVTKTEPSTHSANPTTYTTP